MEHGREREIILCNVFVALCYKTIEFCFNTFINCFKIPAAELRYGKVGKPKQTQILQSEGIANVRSCLLEL